MQHDVHANPAPRSRRALPFVAVLQADLANESRGRIVAPMVPRAEISGASGRLLPVVRHADAEFHLALELMTSFPASALRKPVGSIAGHHDEIVRALGWLLTGA